MMQAFELLRFTKRHISRQNSEEIKHLDIAIIELRLSEGISK